MQQKYAERKAVVVLPSSNVDVREIPFLTAEGEWAKLSDFGSDCVLVVNVASRCGLTPQYEQLEQLQKEYGEQGFTVVGFPCNQFLGQEPGSIEEIVSYCATSWGISFPINDKIKVNGRGSAELYKALKASKDSAGLAGPVMWNFEKFLVCPDGSVKRFRPKTEPKDPAIVTAIEEALKNA